MDILITGATGKIGSRLSLRLAQQGHAVRGLVRDRERAAALAAQGIELVDGDLSRPSSLRAAVRGIEAIVHCAAFFRGATPEQAHAVNTVGTRHLAMAAQEAAVQRLVFMSTGLVYGADGSGPLSEEVACAPADAYARSKLEAEGMLLAMEGLDVRILRLPFVYGDGDPHVQDVAPFMRTFPAEQRMSVGHHVDVAQAVSLVLDAPSPVHRIYNVVDDEAPTLAALFAAVGQPPPDGSDPERARAFSALMDGRRLRTELGFRPLYPRFADAVAAGQA